MENLTQNNGVKESYEIRRKNAIALVKAWAKDMIQTYEEPTRAGTKKGEPIGPSKKKLHACVLMILYGPLGLNLKEIATASKVSPGLIRLWRTEPGFKEGIKRIYNSFTEVFPNTIDLLLYQEYKNIGDERRQKSLEGKLFKGPYLPSYIINGKLVNFRQCDDPISMVNLLSDSIPFLNKTIFSAIAKWLKERIDAGSLFHIFIVGRILKATAKDKKMLRRWEIESLEITKTLLEEDLKLLIESGPNVNKEDRERFMNGLRDIIFQKFDILAS